MANEIGVAKRGLASVLSNIDGLRVFDHAPDSVHEFPAAIVRLESRESVETLGGAVRGSMRVEVLVSAADARQAEAMLDALVEPQGARSIEAAANTDPSWDGAVDYGHLLSVDNIGARKTRGANCVGADFRFVFMARG
ncbi:MAG: hypothetical protein F4X57_13490 [Chloroflexi bacterium]|nr:hypothetical protein [Chloroflexota bacterium]